MYWLKVLADEKDYEKIAAFPGTGVSAVTKEEFCSVFFFLQVYMEPAEYKQLWSI